MDIIHFFENVESVQESEIVSVSGTNYLQLEVMGDASEFKIQVSAQIIDGGEFFPLSILKNNTFTIHNFITENGFYRIDTTGILNIQLKIIKVLGGALSCLGTFVTSQDINWDNVKDKPVNKGEGVNSIKMGTNTHAISDNSCAMGNGTVANGSEQCVEGTYNEIDTNGNYLHIVGNGSSEDNRSNAYTLDKLGNAWFARDVRVGSNRKTLVHEDEVILLTKVSDSFIVSYDLNPGYYLLSGNTQITYHTQEKQFNMDVLPPSIEIVDRYISLEYKTTDSQLLVRIGKPTIDYDTLYFQMPIIFFGNMVNKNDETDCTPILYCCYSGATPGSLTGSIPTAYERTLTYDPVTKRSDIPKKTSDLENDSDYATETYVDNAVATVEDIAKGRATGYVFDTVDDMNTWLANVENKAKLVLGDNLYIRAIDVPDYWWDGIAAQQLETQKVDLTEYATKTEVEEEKAARTAKDTELEEKITALTPKYSESDSGLLIIEEGNNCHNAEEFTIENNVGKFYIMLMDITKINGPFESSIYLAPCSAETLTFEDSTGITTYFGDDCDANGVFTPQVNTHYEISFKRVGTDSDNKPIIIARVGAWQ